MLTLSFWAKNHPASARWLIAFSRVLTGCLAFTWGFALASDERYFSKLAFFASAGLFLLAFAAYPRKRENGLKNFRRRKCCDAALVASSLIFWVGAGNLLPEWSLAPASTERLEAACEPASPMALAAIDKAYPKEIAAESCVKISKKFEAKWTGFFKKLKTWREGFFQKMKSNIRRHVAELRSAAREIDAGTAVLLVLASLAIVALLGYLTAAVSCTLSCNGQEGAAVAVLLLGLAAIIGSIAWMWTAVSRKENRKRQQQSPDAKTQPAPPPTLAQNTIQVASSPVQVCISSESQSRVTVQFDGKVLAENVKIGAVPRCFDLDVKPEAENLFSIRQISGGGKYKLTVQEEQSDRKGSLLMVADEGGSCSLLFQMKK